jgi:hypothetical protein
MRAMPSRSEHIALLYRTHFGSFLDFAFRELHPGQTLRKAWFVDLMADRVESVAKGNLKRLIINAPPRSLKSLIATICLASFVLGRHPDRRILLIFGHESLANEMMQRLRRLVQSHRYRSIFPNVQFQTKQPAITTRHGGQIRSAIVGRPLGGHGADLIVVDDPLSPSRATDVSLREGANSWYDQEVRQRLNNKIDGALVLVMQRVSSSDLSDHLSADDAFEKIVLPSIAPRDEEYTLSNGRRFVRRRGQVLDPDHDGIDDQYRLYEQVGAYAYATQYLQNCCGSEDSPPMLLFSPRPDNWTPETDSGRSAFVRRTFQQRILTEIFGHPPHETDNWVHEHPYTLEEWEAATIVQQRELVASVQGK